MQRADARINLGGRRSSIVRLSVNDRVTAGVDSDTLAIETYKVDREPGPPGRCFPESVYK
jgi:hypothetical protein